jgi:hypothetical protein
VVGEIRNRHRRGASLADSKIPHALAAAAQRHCGSWENAIEMADLDYKTILLRKPEWSRDELILALREAAMFQRRFASTDLLVTAARREFGSVRTALATAGLDPNVFLQKRRWTDRELEEAVRALAAEQPTMSRSEFHETSVGMAFKRRFGTIDAGLARFGLDNWPRRLLRRA